jgi:hypothetical protein
MTTIREGSVVRIRVSVGTKIGRLGVVVRVHRPTGDVVVVWGTGTRRAHLPHVLVMPRETAGLALGLTKPTYFYGHTQWVGTPAKVEVQPGVCPRFLLAALRELVASGA